jgi:hypothetical protein
MSLFRGRFADALFAGRRVRRINHIHLDALVEQLLCFCDILREAPIDLATAGVVQRRVQGRPQPADPLTYLYHLLRDLIHQCPMLAIEKPRCLSEHILAHCVPRCVLLSYQTYGTRR